MNNTKAKQSIRIIVNVVFSLFILLILVFTVFAFSTRANGGIPKIFGNSYVTVLSDSMKGEFERGDLIVIERYDRVRIVDEDVVFDEGQIITFETVIDGNQEYITHRIISVNLVARTYTTQGDAALNDETETVNFIDVVGLYTGKKINNVGNFFLFLQGPVGFFLFIVTQLLVFFGLQVFDFTEAFKEFKKEKKELQVETPEETKTE